MINSTQNVAATNTRISLSAQERALMELAEHNLKFILIREPICWEEAGDIDIVVSDRFDAEKIILRLGYIRISVLYESSQYVKYDWNSGQWIHLDAQSTFKYGATEISPHFIENLFARSHFSELGIPRLDSTDEAILLLLHLVIDKNSLTLKYKNGIFHYDKLSLPCYAESYSFLPRHLTEYFDIIDKLKEGKINEQAAIKEIRSSFNMSVTKRSLWKRILKRLRVLIKGIPSIVFLGPDGAGKSTLTEPLAHLRWPNVRRQFMGPARQSEMKRVFISALSMADKIRIKYSKRHPFGIISRAAWQLICYFDFWDRLLRHFHFWGSGGIVIFDRYPCDMYFRKPSWWNEFLFLRLFARPCYVFLCVGNAELIHQRKPELTSEQINKTITLYRQKLRQYNIHHTEINTTAMSPGRQLKHVVQLLVEYEWFRA